MIEALALLLIYSIGATYLICKGVKKQEALQRRIFSQEKKIDKMEKYQHVSNLARRDVAIEYGNNQKDKHTHQKV